MLHSFSVIAAMGISFLRLPDIKKKSPTFQEGESGATGSMGLFFGGEHEEAVLINILLV